VVIFPLWLQQVMGYTSALAGLATAPSGLLALVFSPIIGKNLHRWDARAVISIGFITFAVVSFWGGSFTLDSSFAQVVAPRFLQGLGIACFFVPINGLILSGIEEHRLASASGLSNFIRTLSAAIGTSISVTLWDHRASFHHARISEGVIQGAPVTQDYFSGLNQLGFSLEQAQIRVENMITAQSYMMAANDFYNLCGVVFILMIGLVWMTRPKRGGAPLSGH
jgi:DHA2 family multidrug resistance protein